MNDRPIVLADDTYTKHGWFFDSLRSVIEPRNRVVKFDGRNVKGEKVRDCDTLIEMLKTLIRREHAKGLVLDLHWHEGSDSHKCGQRILENFRLEPDIWNELIIVVYSKYSEEFRRELEGRLGMPRERVLTWFTDSPNDVAQNFP